MYFILGHDHGRACWICRGAPCRILRPASPRAEEVKFQKAKVKATAQSSNLGALLDSNSRAESARLGRSIFKRGSTLLRPGRPHSVPKTFAFCAVALTFYFCVLT